MFRRLLAVYAHPDDESFGSGGTIATCAADGVEVALVCAPRGGVGASTSEGGTAVTHAGATLRSGLYLPDLTPGQRAEAIRVSRNAGTAGVSTFEMNGLTDEHLAVIRAAL